MPDPHRFLESLRSDSGYTPHHLNFLVVPFFGTFEDHLWWINLPSPRSAYWVRTMAPAKDAFVAARERRGGFHAKMGFDAVEGELVT